MDHFRHCLWNKDSLDWIGFSKLRPDVEIDVHDRRFAKFVKVSLNIGAERCWAKLGLLIPPFCYVGVASEDHTFAQLVISRMKKDWEYLLYLEKLALSDPYARQLSTDMVWARKNVYDYCTRSLSEISGH